MRNLFGNKKSTLLVCIFLVVIAWVFCSHMNEKEELNGTKAERKKFEEYDESNIMYPYIILDNSDLQNQINRQISDAIIEYCESSSICSYEVDYEIKCFNQEYLSILFEGMRIPLGGPHPSDIAWGITFDMKSGKALGITDIIEEKELQDQLSKKLFVTKRGMDIDIYESLAGEADWCEKYTGYSMHYYDKEHKNDFYLSGEAIGIMFGVSHAVGDYIIVEIKTPEESDHYKIPQSFYGTWEVTDVICLVGNMKTPQDYIGKTFSFSEEEDISFQAQMLLKDGECHLLVYFQFADKEKQRENPFSAFVVKSADEIIFITHVDTSCSAKKISDGNKENEKNKNSMSAEDMLKADLRNRKCCNESYLYRTIAGKWQVESDASLKVENEELLFDGKLEIYSDENSLSEKEINDSREFPDLKSHNIYWGITCLSENGRLFDKTPNLRELGIDSDVILYGMSSDNSWNEDCVFIVINQEEMLLVKGDSFYRMVCGNPDTEYVRYDELFWTWKFEWGIDEDDEKLEELVLEVPDYPESEIIPCYYGTWKIAELLGQGDEAVQGASLLEEAGSFLQSLIIIRMMDFLEMRGRRLRLESQRRTEFIMRTSDISIIRQILIFTGLPYKSRKK